MFCKKHSCGSALSCVDAYMVIIFYEKDAFEKFLLCFPRSDTADCCFVN